MNQSIEKLLPRVQKPGRYVGGELHSVVKKKEEVEVRFAFCFPDTYEVGMSHLGMKSSIICLMSRRRFGASGCLRHGWIWKRKCAVIKSRCLHWRAATH